MRKAACLLMLVAGCGGMPAAEVTAGRATVTEAFARCRVVGLDDAETDTLLIAFEQDRENGFTKTDSLWGAIDYCDGLGRTANFAVDCKVCYFAVIDFVYD